MFAKIEYELLTKKYISKDEYKNLVKTYVNELNITYITAKQYICLKNIKKLKVKIILNMNMHC